MGRLRGLRAYRARPAAPDPHVERHVQGTQVVLELGEGAHAEDRGGHRGLRNVQATAACAGLTPSSAATLVTTSAMPRPRCQRAVPDGDEVLGGRIRDWCARSEEFARLWERRDVRVNGRGRTCLVHPVLGG